MASAVDSRLAYARPSAVATASRLPTATRDSNNSYTTSWDTTAVMATDAEWERIGRAAAESGMDLSRFVIHRALDRDPLPPEVLRRAVREMLVLSRLEERRLREGGAGKIWEDACDAVDEWIDREGMLEELTDPGAANRWKAVEPAGEDECCFPHSLDRSAGIFVTLIG